MGEGIKGGNPPVEKGNGEVIGMVVGDTLGEAETEKSKLFYCEKRLIGHSNRDHATYFKRALYQARYRQNALRNF